MNQLPMNRDTDLSDTWGREIDQSIRESRALCVGVFSFDGEVLFSNPAMVELLGELPAASFTNPSFERILGMEPPEREYEPVFSGFVTFSKHAIDTSILARIYRRGKQILVVGEIDVATLSSQYLSVVELNRENNRLQRGLIQQKHALQQEVEQRTTSEARVQKLLEEKVVILKEVHHRIKNNMNTVVSILRLQSRRYDDATTTSILQDAAQRVGSMMLLYDRLYKTSSFYAMDLGAYLIPLIQQVLGVFPHGTSIQVHTEIDPINMSAKRLSELGIIVNELITNAMKHAFADRDAGTLTVSADRTDRAVTLTIADDGPGLPERSPDEASPGFGMTLVNALVSQLNGTLRTENDHGARFILEFEVSD